MMPYVTYHLLIVSDDDGGKLFSPEEYERLHSRLYVSWVNPRGMDCILIGSQYKCLCRHKFSEYKTDFTGIPTERPILISCRCVLFEYVANASGTSDPSCCYKYSRDTHGTRPPYTCQKGIVSHSIKKQNISFLIDI
ncbi:unnamed protein product [Adineta steineri]|uniref:Protein FAM221A n=1 Tax=Adineta steineri TaxID=433720 RepID=A0A820GDM9_9BILA|nr:unnamed protein product [Adineta steineri]